MAMAMSLADPAADRAPPRASDCAWHMLDGKWLSPRQCAGVPPRYLLPGKFYVRRAQSRSHVCRRCGRKFDVSLMTIGYPTTGTQGDKNATAVWMHVTCAAKDAELVEIAREGREKMLEAVLGFDALPDAVQDSLMDEIVGLGLGARGCSPVPEEPVFPESQTGTGFKIAPAKAPAPLRGSLLPFQAEGLAWMLQQEEGECRGGILADEMGMGKTLQIISLILSSSASPTLVVVPVTSLYQWEQEIQRFVNPGSLQLFMFYGAGKALPDDVGTGRRTAKVLVLTTFSKLEREHRDSRELSVPEGQAPPTKRKRFACEAVAEPPLFQIPWQRVVLDEAHRVRNLASLTSQAAMRLKASGLLLVKAVPVIGIANQCDPGTQKCRECKHSRMLHRSIFTSEILTPIRQHGFRDRGKVAMETLRFEVLQKLLLRRTKLAVGIGLPPMHVSEHKVKLSSPERRLYDSVRAQSLAVFEDYATNLTKNFCHVFALLARQRQAACHPLLVNHNKVFSGRCPICQGMAETVLECGHGFHEDCWADYVRDRLHDSEGEEEPSCLACAWGAIPGKEFLQELSGKLRSSSKLDAVASRIEQLLREDPSAKFLVFSQFTHFLEIAHWKLQKWGAGLLCGNTQVKKRQGIVESFQSDPELRILLISLQVGGEGLNLQEANFVMLLDPWWNPAAELQAMQRAHRIGQKRPVKVIRFVSEGTIEEKILELQEKKQKIFDSTIEGNNEALLRLTGEDIQRLFRE